MLHKNSKSLAADIFEEEDGIQAFLTKLADMAMKFICVLSKCQKSRDFGMEPI